MKKAFTILLVLAVSTMMIFANGAKETASESSVVEISLLNSKPEITEALEVAAISYEANNGVRITVYETDSPGDYLTQAYAAGDPTTLALVDYANIKDFSSEYFLDMTDQEWSSIGGLSSGAVFGGKLYGFPFTIEARGMIYNQPEIEELLGEEFVPEKYYSREAFNGLLETLREKGMENPIVINADDWSIGSHYLQTMYSLYDGTMDGGYEFTEKLKGGASIKVAFWLNGTFAWPDFSVFVDGSMEYGVMPLPVSEDCAGYGKLSASATKYVAIDTEHASAEQQQAALDFLSWLVYTPEGNDLLVNKCGAVPAFSNINLEMSNPFNVSLMEYITDGNLICAFADLPADHRSALGDDMQKYIAGEVTREELAATIDAYWQAQN